jgi:hypothetical protein
MNARHTRATGARRPVPVWERDRRLAEVLENAHRRGILLRTADEIEKEQTNSPGREAADHDENNQHN